MDLARLRAIPLFSSLTDEELRRVATFATETSVGEATTILRQGDYATELYVIEEGTARVERDGAEVAALSAGDFFGEIGVLGKELRSASVVAGAPMRLIKLTQWELKRLPPETIDRLRQAVEERRGADSAAAEGGTA
jgi:CRP-like cAMP-binding protein